MRIFLLSLTILALICIGFSGVLDRDGDQSFAFSFPRGSADLWISGVHVSAPRIRCRFEDNRLSIAGIPLQLEGPSRPLSPETLERLYSDVPLVKDLRWSGYSLEAAVFEWQRVQGAFLNQARSILHQRGQENARDSLASSPLVRSFEFRGHHVFIFFWGELGPTGYNFFFNADYRTVLTRVPDERPFVRRSARAVCATLASGTESKRKLVVFLSSRGTILSLAAGSPMASQAVAQIEHLASGKDPLSLPEGPFHVGDTFLSDVARHSSE